MPRLLEVVVSFVGEHQITVELIDVLNEEPLVADGFDRLRELESRVLRAQGVPGQLCSQQQGAYKSESEYSKPNSVRIWRKFMRKVPQTSAWKLAKDVRVPSHLLFVIAIPQEARTLPFQKNERAPGKT